MFDKFLIEENDGFFENYCESAGLKFVDHRDLGVAGIFVRQAVQAFDSHRKIMVSKRKFPNITVGIYDDNDVQAFATKWNDFYVIGISTGFLNQIFTALKVDFSKILSFEKLSESDKALLQKMLFSQCCTFVIEHEFVHIINGHLDFSKKSGLQEKISEKGRSFDEPKPELTISQVLEMDADMCAMSTILAGGVFITSHAKMSRTPDWHPFKNLRNYFSFVYLCSAIVFRIFGDGDYKQKAIGTSTHPLPRVRQYYLMLNLIAFNQAYRCGFEETELKEIISRAFWDAENIVNSAMGIATNKEALSAKFFSQHPLLQEMKVVWKDKVHDELSKYAFGPLVGKNGEAVEFFAPDEEQTDLMKSALYSD